MSKSLSRAVKGRAARFLGLHIGQIRSGIPTAMTGRGNACRLRGPEASDLGDADAGSPEERKPSWRAAALERSMTRPFTNGRGR